MAKLYGRMSGRSYRKEVTRCGDNAISSHLSSWTFGIRTELTLDKSGKVTATIYKTGGSTGNEKPEVIAIVKEESKAA